MCSKCGSDETGPRNAYYGRRNVCVLVIILGIAGLFVQAHGNATRQRFIAIALVGGGAWGLVARQRNRRIDMWCYRGRHEFTVRRHKKERSTFTETGGRMRDDLGQSGDLERAETQLRNTDWVGGRRGTRPWKYGECPLGLYARRLAEPRFESQMVEDYPNFGTIRLKSGDVVSYDVLHEGWVYWDGRQYCVCGRPA